MSGKRPKEGPKQGGNGPVVRFVLTFLVGLLLFQLVFFQVTDETSWFRTYLEWNTAWAAALLRVVGFDARSSGNLLTVVGGGAVRVLRGCDGLQPMAYYVLAVLAFPAPVRRRLLGAAGGLLAFPLLNVVRIATLVLLDRDHKDVFEVAHVTVWPTVFIFLALLLWLLWARWALRPATEPGPAV